MSAIAHKAVLGIHQDVADGDHDELARQTSATDVASRVQQVRRRGGGRRALMRRGQVSLLSESEILVRG
jgi:hypothetical protein